jgi:hypothetical protein
MTATARRSGQRLTSKPIRQHGGIHDLRPIECALLRRERFCEQAGALPAAPRHVVAGDRVMMGAAAAG